jgi:hypothetical protein
MSRMHKEELQITTNGDLVQRCEMAGTLTGAAPEQLIAAFVEKTMPVVAVKIDVYLAMAPEASQRWSPWPGPDKRFP